VLELLHTPGHAKHHLGVVDPTIGAVFSGDSVGVRLPGMTAIRPATPPPDFHLDAALASLQRYRDRDPARIYLAHYGPVSPAGEVLDEAADQLRHWVEVASDAVEEAARRGLRDEHELAHVAETLQRRCTDELRAEEGSDHGRQRALELLNDTRANAAGIIRYLERRRAGTLTPLG
jgi:glyoxylase-like metal-dependent hydrolase (beta-lactamase superfamily II)